MDQSRVANLEGIGVARKKKRTRPSRPPKPDRSPISSAPLSDDTGKVSSDDVGDANSGGKMSNLSLCVARSLPVNGIGNGQSPLPSNNGIGSDRKVKKVKLKVGGVTRTIQAKSTVNNGASGSGSSSRTAQTFDSSRPRKRPISQENSDEFNSPTLDKKSGLKGIPWKDFSKGGFSIGREDMGRKSASEKQLDKSDAARKSKRAPKRRVSDKDFDEEDEDDEIRYLERLKTSKMTGYKELDVDSTREAQKDAGGNLNARKPKSGHMDYENLDDDLSSEGEGNKKKKLTKDSSELAAENKREIALTTRQRARLSKDGPSTQIEFPDGLPPAPSRKQKEKLTEVEQQLKKSEAAQRRKIQNEKAARESEAEAIRKILGQDSSRKKREEKIKKRQEEMAQEKATNNEMLATSTIRTVMGPAGTSVTFPRDMGFPELFDPKPSSYPPPREKCAGPLCINPYKYRDSKSKLPLCSLQCYKAINGNMEMEKAC